MGRQSGPEEAEHPEREHALEMVICPSHAATICRTHLDGVVLHVDACRDLYVLDACATAIAWARSSTKAFFALDAYARAKRPNGFRGGFRDWCKDSGDEHAWPCTPKKLAMRESRTVRKAERFMKFRRLPIDIAVDSSGFLLMEAHLKIAEGGGDLAPRVYFHDDTDGSTGKVHVGFFGPHRHMPNTRTG